MVKDSKTVSAVRRIFLRIARAVVLAYLGMIALVYFSQEKLIFYPSKIPPNYKFNFKNDYQEQWTQVNDIKIHSLLVKARDAKGVILYFHGNGGAMDTWGEVADDLVRKTHYSVWMVDYPGYGKSEGKISSQVQLLDVAEHTYQDVTNKNPGKKIVLFGRSLGSGLATWLASRNPVQALILETPYWSLTQVGRETFPYLPPFVMRYPMPSYEWIQAVKAPILIIHGNDDEIVSYGQGRRLSRQNKVVTFAAIDGGHHNDLAMYPYYWSSLESFLGKL